MILLFITFQIVANFSYLQSLDVEHPILKYGIPIKNYKGLNRKFISFIIIKINLNKNGSNRGL